MSHIVLIGPMAVGKSAIGAALAKQLNRQFADSDHVLAAEFGPIPQIFARHGESGFRSREAGVIAELLSSADPLVLSLGGGAVLDSGTAQLLTGAAVVYLHASEDAIRHRLSAGGRPLLDADIPQGASDAERSRLRLDAWRRIMTERAPLYEQLADLSVQATGSPTVCAARISEKLHSALPTPSGDAAKEAR